MYLSSLSMGYNYSSKPYLMEDIPQFWFKVLDNLPKKELDERLDGLYMPGIASWYEDDGEHCKASQVGFCVRRRLVYVNEQPGTGIKAKYFIFYDKPFDIETAFSTLSPGKPVGIIRINSHKPLPNQINISISLENESGIEAYNAAVLLLLYGDRLLKTDYQFIKAEPLYCKSFESVCKEANFDFEEAEFEFKNVKCLKLDIIGKIQHQSISDLRNMSNVHREAIVPVSEQILLKDIRELIEYSLNDNFMNESREEIVFRTLDYKKIINYSPNKYPYRDSFFGPERETKTSPYYDGFTFTDLFMCARIGIVQEENKIVLFGGNHYERFEFQFDNYDDCYDFGQLLLFFGRIYLNLNNKLAREENYYHRIKSKEGQGFFLMDANENDEGFYIDPDTIKYKMPEASIAKYDYKNYGAEKPVINTPKKNGISSDVPAIDQLNELIGLANVKNDVIELTNLVKLNIKRRELGLPEVPVSLHLVFTGNPGTGKTTVARILAKLYKEIGVLTKGQLVETDRAGLVAGYVGQTALKTQEKINEAMGGILFIDEAYTLIKEGNDFGQEAIDTILKAMEDHRDDFIVIVAGYPDLMTRFINSNPGLKSRFNKYFFFEDYSSEELFRIFESMCDKYHYHLNNDAHKVMSEIIIKMVAEKDDNFANARDIRNIFEHIITRQATRIARTGNTGADDLLLIIADDLK